MIGTNVRGLRHLWRLSGPSLKEVLVNFRDYGPCFCHIFKTEKNSPSGEVLVLFNSHYNLGNKGITNYANSTYLTDNEIHLVACTYQRVMEIRKENTRGEVFPYIYDVVMLPDNFEEEYNKFLTTNAKMIRTLTNKFSYETRDAVSKRAFMYSDGSKNFYQWAISNYYQNGTSMASIRSIMCWNELYGQMAKNLKKSTITAYTSRGDIYDLSEELRLLRRDKRVNDSINMFNTAQKKILKAAELSDRDKDTLSKFYRLSETKKVNFVRKMSTIEDFAEIMRQLRHITSTHFEWNKESFMDFITNVEGMKYEKVFENGDVIMVKVEDYETVKNLAKTTNWCISKNKTYWNQYVEQRNDSTQYIVFDFSRREDDLLSIIGFTTEYNKGITHAHDFTNNDMMKSSDNSERRFLKSFIEKFSNHTGIYNVLKDCGIDITLVAQYDKPLFEWNREAMFKYLYECVNKSNVDILYDKDNSVVVSIKDSNIRYFLGDAYIDNLDSSNWYNQHIVFMDFNMSQFDPNRLQFAIIRNQGNDQEDFCTGLYNEHLEGVNSNFDSKLSQYGLPYNTIRRSDNICVRIDGAFMSFNIPELKKLLGRVRKETLHVAIHDYIGAETFVNHISSSITDSMSFDMLDVFYDNGIKLSTITDSTLVNVLLKSVTGCMVNHGRIGSHDGKYNTPTESDIERFFNNDCDTIDEAFYIGCYLAIKKIIKNEAGCKKPNNLYKRMTNIILMARRPGEVFEELLMEIAGQLDFSEQHDTINSWVSYARIHGSEKMKEYTLKNVLIHKFPMSVWKNIEARMAAEEHVASLHRNNEVPDFAFHPALHQEGEVVEAPRMEEPMWEFLDDEDEEFYDEDEGGEAFEEEEAGEPAFADAEGPF